EFERVTRRDRLLEELGNAGKVLGVKPVAAYPALRLEIVQRAAEELDDLAVDELKVAIGCEDRDQTRNAVDHLTRILLVGAQRFFGALLLLDIGAHGVPADDGARFIVRGHAADRVPSVLSVRPAQSHLGLEGDSRRERLLPFLRNARP